MREEAKVGIPFSLDKLPNNGLWSTMTVKCLPYKIGETFSSSTQ